MPNLTDSKKEWTVGELAQLLSHLPPETKLRIEDADTNWTITKMDIVHDVEAGELWFHPSDYSDMEQ